MEKEEKREEMEEGKEEMKKEDGEGKDLLRSRERERDLLPP
jgi:hypothetical protein